MIFGTIIEIFNIIVSFFSSVWESLSVLLDSFAAWYASLVQYGYGMLPGILFASFVTTVGFGVVKFVWHY